MPLAWLWKRICGAPELAKKLGINQTSKLICWGNSYNSCYSWSKEKRDWRIIFNLKKGRRAEKGRFLYMIRLTTCTNEFNAQLLKGALESEGIPAMLSNEIMSGYIGTQGVDVLVKEENLEAAKKILEQQK